MKRRKNFSSLREVIAIYEGAMRAAGFRKPEEVFSADLIAEFGPIGGMGWGIAYIPMDVPYTYANSAVEGMKWNGYNLYYIEPLGVEDGCVRLKLYSRTM